MNTLIAIVWNEKQADQLKVLYKSIENLGNKNVVIFDDSKNEMYRNEFKQRGYQVLYEDTSGLKSIEERVTYGKNKLREYFLSTNLQSIFWLEGDILCPSGTIERLLLANKHNITAVRPQHGKVVGIFPFRKDVPKDLYFKCNLPNFTLINWEWLCPSRITRISCYGAGCCLISREATSKAEFWVKPFSPATHDILYSMDLDILGYPAFVDTGLLCAHYYKPLKHPDERWDMGGDWNDLDKWRNKTLQWKNLRKNKIVIANRNIEIPGSI